LGRRIHGTISIYILLADAGLLSEVVSELAVVDVDRHKVNPRAMGQRDNCPWHCLSITLVFEQEILGKMGKIT